MTCPSCGAEAPADARFCPSCGSALRAPSDERRVVTVLFADLVGFTGLAETRDPEQVKNMVDACFERLAADVTAFGGRVDKIVGDAIMALFGAPVAHEDDAERAVRAALRMQETVSAYAEDQGAPLRMRIGVNTGEVLVGALRAGGEVTAMGDVVNAASRLQTSAQPGQVLVGPATYAATREVIGYEPLGDVRARGRGEPIPAWVATQPLGPPGTRPRRVRTPLVGRKAELGMLWHAVGTAVANRRPHVVLLVGDAGVGKTRLAEEATDIARDEHGATVLEGRCLPYGEANVWWPIAEALRQACGIDAADPVEVAVDKCRSAVGGLIGAQDEGVEASRVADGLLYLMGYAGPLHDVDPGRAREEALRSLAASLQALAADRPLVVVLSELHWADAVVLEAIDHLLERLRDLPLVVVATARPQLHDRWAPRPGRYNLAIVNLDPLDRRAADRLVAVLLGEDTPEALREVLIERSGGNPLFLEELAALLEESESGGGSAAALPATLRGLVSARLDALEPRERAMLEDAAVLGRRGPAAALQELAAGRGDDAAEVLESLTAKDMIVLGDGSYEFKSDLVRDVAYETLTKGMRARRHAELAQWLETDAGRSRREEELVERIAHHWGAAAELAAEVGGVDGLGDATRQRALGWLTKAGERAETRDTPAMAMRLYGQALRLLGPSEDEARWPLLLGRSRALTSMHELDEARGDAQTVKDEAEQAGRPAFVARALTQLGEIETKDGRTEAALSTLERAVALWQRESDPGGEADALRRWGMANLHVGELDAAEDAIVRALELSRGLEDRRGEAWALQNLAWISFYRGELDLAEERLQSSERLFADIGDFGGRAWAVGLLGYVRYFRGDLEFAGRVAEQTLRRDQEFGDRWGRAMMTNLLASVRLWRGQAADAVELATEARRVFEDIEDGMGMVQTGGTLVWAYALTGRWAEARDLLEQNLDLGRAHPRTDLGARITAADLANLVGRPEEVPALTGAEPLMEQAGRAVAGALALAHLLSGEPQEGTRLLEEVPEPPDGEGELAYTSSLLALLRAASGRPEDALEAADTVSSMQGGSYLDRVRALLGRGFALVQLRREAEARTAFTDAASIVEPSQDRVHRVLVRLAAGVALAVPDAGLVGLREELSALGVRAEPWERAFSLAAAGGREKAATV